MLIIAVSFKIGVAPFHFWVPHVYSGIRITNILIISTIIKIPSFVVISNWSRGVWWVVFFLRVSIGAFRALFCNNIKKLIAYSRVSHRGWIIILTPMLQVWVFYIVVYYVRLWFVIYCLIKLNLRGISLSFTLTRPVITTSLSILVLSLAGMPPFVGFSIKWVALRAILRTAGVSMVIVLVVLALRIYFYFQIVVTALLNTTYERGLNIYNRTLCSITILAFTSLLFILPFI